MEVVATFSKHLHPVFTLSQLPLSEISLVLFWKVSLSPIVEILVVMCREEEKFEFWILLKTSRKYGS